VLGHETAHQYDARNQRTCTTGPLPDAPAVPTPPEALHGRPVSTFAYDARGNLRAATDPVGATTSYQYDQLNRLVRITEPSPGTGQHEAPVTRFVYDAAGQLVETLQRVEHGWRTTTRDYDDLGRQRWELLPADQAGQRPMVSSTYDLRDNILSFTGANGAVTVYEYDQQDRLRATVHPDPDGPGPLGQPTEIRQYNADGTLRYEATCDANDPGTCLATRYQHDALGRVVSVVKSDPDGVGPLNAPHVTYQYDVLGNRRTVEQAISDGSMAARRLSYDNLGRLWRTIHEDAGAGGEPGVPALDGELIRIFDGKGQVTRQLERVSSAGGAAEYRRTDFTYDALGRLVSRVDPAPVPAGIRPATFFTYDAVGNLRFERDPAGNWTEYQPDALHRTIAVIEPATEDHASPRTSFEYTVSGDLRATVDALGRRTEYAYDDLGRRVAMQLPAIDGRIPTVHFAYDMAGNLTSVLDADGQVTQYDYDALNRTVAVTTGGVRFTRTFDGLGRVAAETDARGTARRYGYDILGRQTSVTPPSPTGREPIDRTLDEDQATFLGQWTTAFGGHDEDHAYVVADGATTLSATWSFDGLHPSATYAVLATWDPQPANAAQVVFRVTEPAGELATESVDQRALSADVVADGRAWQRIGRVTVTAESLEVIVDASAAVGQVIADGVRLVEMSGATYATFDARGNLVKQTDGLGNVTTSTYDARGNKTSVTDPNGCTSSFDYDLLGRLVAVTDPLGNTTRYRYDDLDRVTHEYVELDGVQFATRYEYDVVGNLRQITDPLGRVRWFRHDALGRMTEERWYASTADAAADVQRLHHARYLFDPADRLLNAVDAAAEYRFSYDALDRARSTVIQVGAIPTVVLYSGYTRADELRDSLSASVAGDPDFETTFHYDALRRMTRIDHEGAADKRIDIQYTLTDQFARIERFADLDAVKPVIASQFDYDGQGHVTSLSHRQGPQVLADYAWSYDAAGRVIRFESSRDGAADYRYDAAGQLVAADYDRQSLEQYSYDASGNRSGGDHELGARNRILSDDDFLYQYDACGNRTKRIEKATGKVTRYGWDAANRLTSIEERDSAEGSVTRMIEYRYDVFGRRVGKTIAPAVGPVEVEDYVYDGQQIVLRFANGNLANRYVYGPAVDQVLADEQIDPGTGVSQVFWPLTDNLGSVRDVAEYDQRTGIAAVAEHRAYSAFGKSTVEAVEAVDHIFGFAGREADSESDLLYYRARYYDPGLGQFLSEDPARFEAGDVNLRRYVGNSPTNTIDPTGLYGDDVHFYFNYYLARYLELDQPTSWINSKGQPVSEALIIAYFATRIDYDATTKPVGTGAYDRSRYHFADPNKGYGVREDDPRVRTAIEGVARRGDLEMFGVLLHVYQDSFAHVYYGNVFGHAGAGHAPDEPFRNTMRDWRMAKRVYEKMELLAKARESMGGPVRDLEGKSFEE
ncbi:MAG: RHS repeat-associated core domain-containing protein, partial [Planctomycetes bacterium]|nr:RHS repeat-associated core domain-containing protein [Planctomycetota bacterium]